MLRRVMASAVVAGLAAGVVAALLQALITTPLILEAELFEAGAVSAGGHSHAAGGPGLARFALSALASLVLYTGFALILVGLMALAGRGELDAKQGLAWGLAGFAVVAFAPALGLPPELPGSAGGDLPARQAWWLATALATAAALWLVAFARGRLVLAAALALAATPHLIGAPGGEGAGVVPADLAARFVVASLAVSAVSWALLGAVAGAVFRRFDGGTG